MPAGYLAFGALAGEVGTQPTLLAAAAVVAVTNVAVALVPCVRALTADDPELEPARA